MGTLMAPFRGFVELTVGIVPVVKDHTTLLARLFPAGSFAPVVIAAVYSVPPVRSVAGAKVAVVPEYVTVPVSGDPPGPITPKVEVLIVVAFIALLKVAVTICATGTPVAPFAGTAAMTVGAAFEPAAVVKFHGLGTAPAINALPLRSLAAFVIVAVN
jgi:hypothetical protein